MYMQIFLCISLYLAKEHIPGVHTNKHIPGARTEEHVPSVREPKLARYASAAAAAPALLRQQSGDAQHLVS